jgi:ComF family protein
MKTLFSGLADLVFPPECTACGALVNRSTDTFCDSCFSRIRFIRSPLCPRCGIPYGSEGERDHLCADCILSEAYVSMARAAGEFGSTLLDVVHKFKYQGLTAAGEALGRFMAGLDYEGLRIRDYTLIIPVPLHRKKLRERGFNQAVILAAEISRRHGVPMDFVSVKRRIHTEPQAGLGRDDRLRNMKGAFEVVKPEAVADEKILLIDDVYTTGSTVGECAKALRESGAGDVSVLTLARAV